MCNIIDTNRINGFLSKRESQDNHPIYRWLERKRGKIVYSTGDRFSTELTPKTKQRLAELSRSGWTRSVADLEIEHKAEILRRNQTLKSDDHHVLALATVSGARLLYTHDEALILDFKNPSIISKPRGKIYWDARQKNLQTNQVCQTK